MRGMKNNCEDFTKLNSKTLRLNLPRYLKSCLVMCG